MRIDYLMKLLLMVVNYWTGMKSHWVLNAGPKKCCSHCRSVVIGSCGSVCLMNSCGSLQLSLCCRRIG
jgi:hypothetical protein